MATLQELIDDALRDHDSCQESEADAIARVLSDKVVLRSDLEPITWAAQQGYRLYAEKVS